MLNYLSMTLKILQHIYLNIDGVIVQLSLLHFLHLFDMGL